MDKKQIETFIKKYNLSGTIEGVLWTNAGGNLKTTAMTTDKKLFAAVEFKDGASFFKDVEVGISNTQKLRKQMAVLDDTFSLSLNTDSADATRVLELVGDDGNNDFHHVTAQKDVIEPAPVLKTIPPYTVEVVINPKFVDTFSKAFAAVGDDAALFTLIMSKKKQKLELVLGYKQQLSDRIAIGVETVAGKDAVVNPISFSAKHFKEILAANGDATDAATLSVSEAGLASVKFEQGDFKSQYYMVKIDVED